MDATLSETTRRASDTYARWLFGSAALVNFVVGLGLLLLHPFFATLLHLDPAHGTNLFFYNFSVCLVALFGYGYLRLADDPAKYRPYIPFSVMGKSLAVLCMLEAWAVGAISWLLPALVSIDAIYAALFLDYLRRSRPA